MSGSTPLRDAFVHEKAGHCGSGSLRDLLRFHGLDFGTGPLSEGMAFGLGGGVGFLYAQTPDGAPSVYLVGRTGGLEADFARHLGVPLEVRETDDPAEGWAWVREAVDARRPPLVWSDIAELEYLRVRMTNSRHSIVVVDYDEAAGVAWIADNDREDLQPCSLASLAAARASRGFPGPARHRLFDYAWPERLGDPGAAVRAAVATTVDNMTFGGAPLAAFDGTGLAGVEAFARAFPAWPATFGDRLPEVLGVLRVLIVKAGTGGAMFRSLQAAFLHDAADLLEDAALARAGETYDRLAATWVALADAAGAGDHAAGAARVAELAVLEHDGVAALRAWLAA